MITEKNFQRKQYAQLSTENHSAKCTRQCFPPNGIFVNFNDVFEFLKVLNDLMVEDIGYRSELTELN
jgi:predicted ATPase